MSAQANTEPSKFDFVKWILAFAILFGGIYAYNVLAEHSILIRAGIVIAAVVIAIAVAMMTAKGKALWQFVKGARTELRKVIWPKTNETTRMTIVVIIMIIILGAFLWLLDWLINSFLIQPILG
jgi:preprotein translocase subunit SecE